MHLSAPLPRLEAARRLAILLPLPVRLFIQLLPIPNLSYRLRGSGPTGEDIVPEVKAQEGIQSDCCVAPAWVPRRQWVPGMTPCTDHSRCGCGVDDHAFLADGTLSEQAAARDAPLLRLLFRRRWLVLALADHGDHEEDQYEQHADHDQVRHTLPHVVLLVASVDESHSTKIGPARDPGATYA